MTPQAGQGKGTVFDRLRARRLRRAEMELADAQHHFDTWTEPFHRRLGTVEPSRMAREEAKLSKLKARVERLSAGQGKPTTEGER